MMVVLVGQGRAMESHNNSNAVDPATWLEQSEVQENITKKVDLIQQVSVIKKMENFSDDIHFA